MFNMIRSTYESSFGRGSPVRLNSHQFHDPNDPKSSNWSPSMNKYVGAQTVISKIVGTDNWGYLMAQVDIDHGAHNWRIYSMDDIANNAVSPQLTTPLPVIGAGNVQAIPVGPGGAQGGPGFAYSTPNLNPNLWGDEPPKKKTEVTHTEVVPDKDKTVIDSLTEWNKAKIRELNKIAKDREKVNPYDEGW